MKKAKVRYNVGEDKFEILINTGDGWGLDTAYPCVARENGILDKVFIHWSVLNKLAELQAQGYTINILGGGVTNDR